MLKVHTGILPWTQVTDQSTFLQSRPGGRPIPWSGRASALRRYAADIVGYTVQRQQPR
jgi:hypothetical protein